MKLYTILSVGICCAFALSCDSNTKSNIDLSGEWKFKTDVSDKGIAEKWYGQQLSETIRLPGSMAENNKGDDIGVNSEWTGQIVDSAWYHDEKYAKFREEGNVKIPYWLQPVKHYIGTAWYQKEVEIPTDWKDKRIHLKLERPHWETQLWVNDRYVGKQNSLGTPHVYELTDQMPPGKHFISIRVDNRIKDIDPGINAHSISDHTQSNWNGIAGAIELTASPLIGIEEVKLYPDIKKKEVVVKGSLKNASPTKQTGKLTLGVTLKGEHAGEPIANVEKEITVKGDTPFEVVFPMGNSPLLWDEFNPNVYTMDLHFESTSGIDLKQVVFGMREFKADGKQFAVNGRPVFLRGTLECAIFPKTGYPATDIEEWKRILNICKAHGLNHMRFHSWCPPEAAFNAADEVGVYLQVEASSWANVTSSIGDGLPIDDWLYKEAEDILNAYGNHPSFVMMAYGNEPRGENQGAYLDRFVTHLKKLDNRHVYTGGAGWPYLDNLDFYNDASPRIQGWGQALNSVINAKPPQTRFDFGELIQKTPMPYVSHEIGQWCVYPNFREIEKYTGVLKAKNFEIFQETLEENHMGHLADSLLLASGKLQALCYKADIEAALRTKNFAGFQLLDLHDFPGQGTALVGVLDAFWEEKGYISPEEYRRFCNETVPLARFSKRIFYDNEPIVADIEVAHFGEFPLKEHRPRWILVDTENAIVAEGAFRTTDIPIGNGFSLGNLSLPVKNKGKAQKLTLKIEVAGNMNSWDLWVYPSKNGAIAEDILLVDRLDKKAMNTLNAGGKVLLSLRKGSLKPEKGGDIAVGFSSIFWNTAWTAGQAPHTLGVLVDPKHSAFDEFPTEYHSNWQWWDAMSHSDAIIMNGYPSSFRPIVRVVDDWFTNRRLGLVFEAKVGKGKLLVSGIDFWDNIENRPAGKQLLYSLKKYMAGKEFEPKETLSADTIIKML